MSRPTLIVTGADLALFELFDCSLIGEGVLHFLAHAREHLLRADARFLPAGGRLRAQVIEYRFDRVLGVDAALLNPYMASLEFVNVDARTLDYRPLTAPFDLFDFDFATAGPEPQELEIEPVATADGTASALLFWFDLRLDGDTVLIRRSDVAENGAIVVALVDDAEVTLKRLRRRGNSIALEPANKAYETRIFGPDRVKVQGRLVGLLRKY